jgi:hypothetical protein
MGEELWNGCGGPEGRVKRLSRRNILYSSMKEMKIDEAGWKTNETWDIRKAMERRKEDRHERRRHEKERKRKEDDVRTGGREKVGRPAKFRETKFREIFAIIRRNLKFRGIEISRKRNAECPQLIVHCSLPTVLCLLPIVYCQLSTVHAGQYVPESLVLLAF